MSKQKWKALLDQHDKLVKTSTATLYDRVTLLKKVYEDGEYLAAAAKRKETPTKLLDSKVSDTCANFMELLQILNMFPRRGQWEEGNLSEMRFKMIETLRKKQQTIKKNGSGSAIKKTRQTPETVERATMAEVRELKADVDKSMTELEHLKTQIKEKDKRISDLEKALDTARITIGELQESKALLKMQLNNKNSRSPVTV